MKLLRMTGLVAVCYLGLHTGAQGDEPVVAAEAKPAAANVPAEPTPETLPVPAAQQTEPAKTASTGGEAWRYKRHNNQWWYWLPEERWVYWKDGAWVLYDVTTYKVPAQAQTVVIQQPVVHQQHVHYQPAPTVVRPVYAPYPAYGVQPAPSNGRVSIGIGVGNPGIGYPAYGPGYGPGYSNQPRSGISIGFGF